MEWPTKIEDAIITDIVAFEKHLYTAMDLADSIIAYNSLTLRYREPVDYDREVAHLKSLYQNQQTAEKHSGQLWKIPVCYHPDFGLDLEALAAEKGMDTEALITLHSAPRYRVYFLGFQPGFLYLGGLPAALHTPRKANPRLRVAAGSVGIGGEQTGVYPSQTSGGWNLMGRSPIRFFDIQKPQPCFAQAGDCIQFCPISMDEFQAIQHIQENGDYTLKPHRL